MKRIQIHLAASCLGALPFIGAMLALGGCSGDTATSNTEPRPQAVSNAAEDGASTPISDLPFIDSATTTQHLGELLAKPTALGETTALHVRLPPPRNPALADSLVRVIGDPDSLQVMVRSDTLAQLGVIPKSPGEGFFTAFATVAPDELDRLQRDQEEIASGAFGATTDESVLFNGRTAAGRTVNPGIDALAFQTGIATSLKGCRPRPVSTLQAWGQSLFITDPKVVLDPTRTWDPCTGVGTKGGVWTFAHFIREMSIGSSLTPADFAKEWLSLWLNTYVVNGDTVPARMQMFNQVIQPWAAASGSTAALVQNTTTLKWSVTLTKPLDLDIAPFRLIAIVNRIDLGGGGGGYNSSSASLPKDAGELRFIFNVVQPNPWGAGTEASCGRKLFTTIFEYGVPITDCPTIVNWWAKQWVALQTFPGFTPAYLAQLQAMTEFVVLNGAAPLKGNKNAINQIRTNEAALGSPWELREFTLTKEQPETPVSGPLRPHTVAKTPDDAAFGAGGLDPTINSFVNFVVIPLAAPPVSVPLQCSLLPAYDVPYSVPAMPATPSFPPPATGPFRGGNSFILPGHWNANSITNFSTPAQICARHQFSLTTCNGCHFDESGTNGLSGSTKFTHINPLSPIAAPMLSKLSKFLTGGGLGLVFNVNDPQLGAPAWPFADLERRFQHLFDLSHCTTCIKAMAMQPQLINAIQALGPVPADVGPDDRPPFEVGPITDPGVVQRLLELRSSFAGVPMDERVDFIRPVDASSH